MALSTGSRGAWRRWSLDPDVWSRPWPQGTPQINTLPPDTKSLCPVPHTARGGRCTLVHPACAQRTSLTPSCRILITLNPGSFTRTISEEKGRGAHRTGCTASPAWGLTQSPLSALSLPGKKCTYGIKCKFYHPERSHHAQLAVADELRAQTRTWRGAGANEERPRGRPEHRGVPAASWHGPREPGTHSLPPARRPADVAALEDGLSRVALNGDPGIPGAHSTGHCCGLVPRSRCSDWVAPRASLSLPALPGLPNPQSPSGPLVQAQTGDRSGDCPGDLQSDLLSQRRGPTDPWALPRGATRFPGRSAGAQLGWGEGALWGPLGSATGATASELDSRARARTALCSIFPPHQVDSVMALFPAVSDVTRLIALIQRCQQCGAPVGNP